MLQDKVPIVEQPRIIPNMISVEMLRKVNYVENLYEDYCRYIQYH
jgi:hypothetical protein